jgi:hypothetical protein
MKLFFGTFFLSLFFLAFSFGEESKLENTLKPLDQLRKEYLSDKAALDQINQTKDRILEKNKDQKMPNSGPEWKKALEVWLPLRQKEKASYPKYLNALVKAYCELPQTDKKAEELKKEIETQHPDHSKNSLTESYYERHSLLANAIMPNLYNDDLNKDRAEFFVKLLKPSFNTKTEDFFHFFRLPVEPQDWSVQTAYSLANLRAGNFPTARKENKKLIKKGSKFADLQKKKEEKGKDSRYAKRLQEFHLQRALIEVHDGKEQEARKFLAKALEMSSSAELDPNVQKLVKETKRALANLKK